MRALEEFRVLLERLANGQPERSLIYSGLRRAGKTVLLLAAYVSLANSELMPVTLAVPTRSH
jgi:hypothetical protein